VVLSRRETFTCQTRDVPASDGLPQQKTCAISKEIWLDGFLGVEPRSVGVAFSWRPPRLGRRAVSFLNYTLASALQQRKSTENLNQGSPVATGLPVAQTWLSFEGLPRLACWTSVHLGFPGDFSQPSVGTSACQVAGLRGSPYQLTSSRNSR
jgi:hypothetical protein